MPHTRIYQQPSDIKEMLNQYGEIFIKPLGGALGKGIIRVMQTPLECIGCIQYNKNFTILLK